MPRSEPRCPADSRGGLQLPRCRLKTRIAISSWTHLTPPGTSLALLCSPLPPPPSPLPLQLTKTTSVQETGVASGLVEVIQGCGFAVQTLSLSFDDDVEAQSEFFKAFRAGGAPLAGAAEATVVLE